MDDEIRDIEILNHIKGLLEDNGLSYAHSCSINYDWFKGDGFEISTHTHGNKFADLDTVIYGLKYRVAFQFSGGELLIDENDTGYRYSGSFDVKNVPNIRLLNAFGIKGLRMEIKNKNVEIKITQNDFISFDDLEYLKLLEDALKAKDEILKLQDTINKFEQYQR